MKTSVATFKYLLFTGLIAMGVYSSYAQDFKPDASYYGVGFWTPDTLGNHRAVVEVHTASDMVAVTIPWRRRDANPEEKGIVIMNAATGKQVANVLRRSITGEKGEIIFDASGGKGEYYIYYMPYKTSGGPYPKINYVKENTAPNGDWVVKAGRASFENLPQGRFRLFESLSSFDSFYPMEVIATEDEKRMLEQDNGSKPFILFPEYREYPIRMFDNIPYRWAVRGAPSKFVAEVDLNEYFVFQLGLWANRADMKGIRVVFSDLTGAKNTIPASAMTCFNTEGRDWLSRPMKIDLNVRKGAIQPLWIGVDIPAEGVARGVYKGQVTVFAGENVSQTVNVELNLSDRVLTDRGDGDLSRLTRLRWLNSDFAMDDSIVKPFIPLRFDGNTISFLGRDVTVNQYGLPSAVNSYFTQEMTGIGTSPKAVIHSPVKLVIQQGTKILELKNESFGFTAQKDGVAAWTSDNQAGDLDVKVEGTLECDGFMEYKITIKALETTTVQDIRLEVPINDKSAKYWLGLNAEGAFRPKKGEWKWDVKKNQEGYWFGDVNAGVQCLFRDENYVRPLNTNFYQQKPLHMPVSWYNNGLGGISFAEKGHALNVTTYSGKRVIKQGEELHFIFLMSVTPFKPIDVRKQWADRYIHSYLPVEDVVKKGPNVINIHHANPINPFINYPFLRPDFMKQYIDEAHKAGMKVKIYYTVRELANRAPELWALRSLGEEVFSPGNIGGYSWLREHLGDNYIAAWFVDKYKDAAIVNSGVSRWHNYYIEGLEWLVKNIGIDGLYIDDLAIDRTTMKRVRKVLERHRPDPRVDLHSANQFNAGDGFINSAFLYMEHMPYLDRLWFGEYFKYEKAPDYWMTEVSGIPFGMMGEMLQDDGNPWRGMLYGMTARYMYHGKETPKFFWKVWDDFGIQDSKMLGYWVDYNPVTTSSKEVLATTFVKDGAVMIALASWAGKDVEVKLTIDWERLGLDKSKARLYFPVIGDIQAEKTLAPEAAFKIEKDKGHLIILK